MGQSIIQRPKSNWSTILILIILAAASTVPLRAAQKLDSPIDDAYITLVYARSIADGDGFRAHPSADPSLGTTSPLWAMILAFASKILPFVQMDDLAIGLSVWIWIATGWLWAWKGKVFGLNRLTSLCIATMLLIETTFWVIHLGMESRLFCLLLTLSIMLYFEQRYLWSGIITGFLFLTRSEGTLVFAAIAIYEAGTIQMGDNTRALNDPARRIGHMISGFLIVFGMWTIYALLTIGRVLPHTLQAKGFQVELGFIESFSSYALRTITLDWANLGHLHVGFNQSPTLLSVWIVLATIGIVYVYVFQRTLLVFINWIVLFAVGYVLLKAPGYTWYPLPIVYTLTIFAAIAIASIGEIADRLIRETAFRPFQMGKALSFILLLLILTTINESNIPPHKIANPAKDDYANIGKWADEHTPPDASIAYLEVGALAWHTNRKVIDLLGLISPELLPYVREGDYAAAFQHAQPDYLVYVEPFSWALDQIIYSDFFEEHYFPVATVPITRGDFLSVVPNYTIYQYVDQSPSTTVSLDDYRFDFASPVTQTNGLVDIAISNDGSFSAVAGFDPYLYQLDLHICADDFSHIVVRLAASEKIVERSLQVFFTSNTDFSQDFSVTKRLAPDAEPHSYVIITDTVQEWHGLVTGLRIDPVGGDGPASNNTIHIQDFRLIRRDGPTRCTD